MVLKSRCLLLIVYGCLFKYLVFAQTNPNLIIYLADDQNQLDYGCYGNPLVQTSAVDRLSKEGILFENAYVAQAICAPSRSMLYTGMYPLKNGCYANHTAVKPNVKSITYYLKKAGYNVILSGKSHVKPNSVFNWSKYVSFNEKPQFNFERFKQIIHDTKQPYCLIIASELPHGPYPKSSDYNGKTLFKLPYESKNSTFNKAGYYQNIEDDNNLLAQVLNILEASPTENNTLFVYASDHGITRKWSLYEPGLRVPLIVKWPKVIDSNTRSDVRVSLIDILPTFLDVAGQEIPKDIDGKSFYSVLKGNNKQIHEYLYAVSTRQNVRGAQVFPSRSVRDKRYKYIKNFNAYERLSENLGDNSNINAFIKRGAEAFKYKPYEELYDLNNDPYEKNNLAAVAKYSFIKNKLSKQLDLWMINQDDILLQSKMPILKANQHPLDKKTRWNKIPDHLVNTLNETDYLQNHY